MRRVTALALLGVAILLAGCARGGTGTDITDPPILLEKEKAWQAFGIRNYTVVQQRNCSCPDGQRQARLTVRNGQLVSGTWLDDSTAVSAAKLDQFRTMDGLFAQIRAARAARAIKVDVTWDEKFSFPRIVDVDLSLSIAQDEYTYTSTNFIASTSR